MLVCGYDARDRECPCRACWAPGLYEHRGSTLSGSRNTGSVTRECLTRAYAGCPMSLPIPQHDFGQRRRACARCGCARQPTPPPPLAP